MAQPPPTGTGATPVRQGFFEAPAVSDAMDDLELPSGVATGVGVVAGSSGPVAGPAHTATVVASDEPAIPGLAEYLDEAAAGDVLVLGWTTTATASVGGGLAATRTAARGCVGLVTDGWVRDLDEVRSLPLTVWARGSVPRSGKGRLAVTGIGQSTEVSGVLVPDRGGVVVDSTGVCVVPLAHLTEVLRVAEELQRRDELFRQVLAVGGDFGDARARAGTM